MVSSQAQRRAIGVRQVAVVGMLSAISVALGLSGYGFIPLPIAKATILHIPVLIGAILEGPVVGAAIGLIFGLFSILQNITAPTALSFAFINPLVSVFPRMLIGIASYYAFRSTPSRIDSVRVGVGAAVGSLTNTVGVLSMIYILYASRYADIKGITVSAAAKVIFGIALTNGLAEAAVAVAVAVPVVAAVRRVSKAN